MSSGAIKVPAYITAIYTGSSRHAVLSKEIEWYTPIGNFKQVIPIKGLIDYTKFDTDPTFSIGSMYDAYILINKKNTKKKGILFSKEIPVTSYSMEYGISNVDYWDAPSENFYNGFDTIVINQEFKAFSTDPDLTLFKALKKEIYKKSRLKSLTFVVKENL